MLVVACRVSLYRSKSGNPESRTSGACQPSCRAKVGGRGKKSCLTMLASYSYR
jgi:hypothetical protein